MEHDDPSSPELARLLHGAARPPAAPVEAEVFGRGVGEMKVRVRSFVGTGRLLGGLVLLACAAFLWSCSDEASLFVDPYSAVSASAAISGTVTFGGAPLEGVEVRTVPATVSARTDYSGHYELKSIPPQTLAVVMEKTGYETFSRTLTLLPGAELGLDVEMRAATGVAHVRGTITDGEVPLAGVEVYTEPSTLRLVTGLDGVFDLPAVQPGIYTIHASLVGFEDGSLQVLAEEGRTTNADMALSRRTDGVILGYVYDPALVPLSGARVVLFDSSGDRLDEYYTGGDGGFSFADLETGYYLLSVERDGYYPGSRYMMVYGGVTADGDVVLYPEGTSTPYPGCIAGVVWDDSHVPLPGATVTVTSVTPSSPTTTTDAMGRFLFTGLPAGTHTLTYSAAGWSASAATVQVGALATADASIALRR